MKAKQLQRLGIPKQAQTMRLANEALSRARRLGLDKKIFSEIIAKLVADPEAFLDHEIFSSLAKELLKPKQARQSFTPRGEPAPWQSWGQDLEPEAVAQMESAARLPVAVAGALMPDAHLGYGLPIGGVLAAENAVIPYAVGVDIACRMRLSVLDMAPDKSLGRGQAALVRALEQETRFGVGARFGDKREHQVMDEDWSFSPVLAKERNKAWGQLGTSGSGNHFVEFGLLVLDKPDLGLEPGEYLALLSHSGSRGAGSATADHYSRLAREQHPELPRELRHLAWLDMDQDPGREYWMAMELMGRYAAANHELIHHHIARNLGAQSLLTLENHHNFAWREQHRGKEVVVHRKGATPAGKDALGIIPGSMTAPGFVVRGRGEPLSLHSASHGAGRRMSRKAAKNAFTWKQVKQELAKAKVTLLSAGLDEAPMAYKDINQVLAAQADLVDIVARFTPRLVKMAD